MCTPLKTCGMADLLLLRMCLQTQTAASCRHVTQPLICVWHPKAQEQGFLLCCQHVILGICTCCYRISLTLRGVFCTHNNTHIMLHDDCCATYIYRDMLLLRQCSTHTHTHATCRATAGYSNMPAAASTLAPARVCFVHAAVHHIPSHHPAAHSARV